MSKQIPFIKMHGLGNDFIVINTLNQPIIFENLPIAQLSHRHLGIGFDQLLAIGPSSSADFSCRIFNADGSEAEQCGNGMRCVARFLHEEQLWNKATVSIETKAGIVQASLHDYNQIQVTMGIPFFKGMEILTLDDKQPPIKLAIVSMGNPHAILQTSSIKNAAIKEWSHRIASLPIFPEGINIGFMEIINRQHIRLLTYERGAGATLACGSNACAAVASGIADCLLDNRVKVELALGNLTIEWQNPHTPVLMTGPASRIFSGEFYI